MSSFTELVIAFRFDTTVPAEVLSAFASVAQLGPDDPEISPLQHDEIDEWDPTDPDSEMGVPWSHDWGELLSWSMAVYMPGETRASLRRRNGQWCLTARCNWQCDSDIMISAISWMAEFSGEDCSNDYPALLGYLKWEGDERPALIWHNGDEFLFEILGDPTGMYTGGY